MEAVRHSRWCRAVSCSNVSATATAAGCRCGCRWLPLWLPLAAAATFSRRRRRLVRLADGASFTPDSPQDSRASTAGRSLTHQSSPAGALHLADRAPAPAPVPAPASVPLPPPYFLGSLASKPVSRFRPVLSTNCLLACCGHRARRPRWRSPHSTAPAPAPTRPSMQTPGHQ